MPGVVGGAGGEGRGFNVFFKGIFLSSCVASNPPPLFFPCLRFVSSIFRKDNEWKRKE